MDAYYQCDDPLPFSRVKQQKSSYASPYRTRASSRQDSQAAPKPSMSGVWNVVSSLVQALGDARDELLTLLTSDGVRVARKSAAATTSRHSSRSPSRSPCRTPSRPYTAPSDSRRSRSPIRTPGDCGRSRTSNSSGHQKSHKTTRTTYYSPPVSFGMNLQFDNVRRGRSPPAGYRRPAARYEPMTLNQRGITPHGNLEYFPAVPAGHGERRRHCAATRFADLLQAETYQLRDRRLAEESVTTQLRSKPSWY